MNSQRHTSATLDGLVVRQGDIVRVNGRRGTFRFVGFTVVGGDSWVDVFGGTANHERTRSFPPGRVHPVGRRQRRAS